MTSELIPVRSSCIRAIGYQDGTLIVRFTSGRVYDHSGVPYPVFRGFLQSASKGWFYNSYIRGRYR